MIVQQIRFLILIEKNIDPHTLMQFINTQLRRSERYLVGTRRLSCDFYDVGKGDVGSWQDSVVIGEVGF
jgi:hypothetical protein